MARDDPPISYSARPTVRIEDTEYPLLSAQISSMRMREGIGGMSSLDISFQDWIDAPDGSRGYGAAGADNPLKLGNLITIHAGQTTGPQEIFSGVITAIESEIEPGKTPLFTVLAEDLLFGLRKTRKSKLFEDKSPRQVAEEITSDHRLTPQIREGLEDPVCNWMQAGESDLAFLRRVLGSCDADLQLVGSDLQIGPVARDERTSVELAYPGDLIRVRATADLAEQYAETRVSAMDVAGGEIVQSATSDGELGPGEGRTGKQILEEKFAAYRNHLRDHSPLDQAGVDMRAEAMFGQQARRFVQAEGTAVGNAEIRIGSWLVIHGMNPVFANQYSVVEAIHRYDREEGYFTDFTAQCAYLGEEV